MKKQNGFIGVIVLILLGVIALSVLMVAFDLITIPWLKFGSKVKMNREIVTKTYNADNAIYNYHWFQERAGAIKATKAKIEIAKDAVLKFELDAGPRKDWTFEDKNEHSRLSAVHQGLQSHYESLVTEYNAKAGEADRGIFADDLPLFFQL